MNEMPDAHTHSDKHSTHIHPSAVVDPGAVLGDNVRIGAFTLIGANVVIGKNTIVGPHCSIQGHTQIGQENHFVGHASVGADAQDKKYAGEHAELHIGDKNVIREFVTINRGTVGGGGRTVLGDDNWLLAYTHVAHDCQVGSHCVFSNNTTLAGHVVVGDYVIISGFSGAHQFCRIGSHAFLGMGALTNGDVPPFTTIGSDTLGRPRGINSEGLKRRGFSPERITMIKRAYRALYMSKMSLNEAKHHLQELATLSTDVEEMLHFLEGSQRPLLR